jgi:hypothetical protein
MPKKLSDSELMAILAAEKADALAAMTATRLSQQRADAMDYYLGDMAKDMPAIEGRSRAVSTDVADTIEGLMPSLMEIFAAGDEVVRFEPVGPEDVAAAEQETDYVNHVFMQQNPGFVVLYSFIKDALLSKVGIVKVFWEEREVDERETYLDQSEDAFAVIAATPGLDIVEHSERAGAGGQTVHDVTVSCKRTQCCARVEPVPPEEFGIARRARSIRDADYCFHEVVRTETDLIAQGFDAAQVRALPSVSSSGAGAEESARDTVDEGAREADAAHRALRPIRVTEHYIRMDYEGTGTARLYRVTTGGEDEILRRNGEPDIVAEDMIRFAAMTPVIVTHRFFGRSIADLVMDIQRIKTALLRALLDNAYLANNPRVEVSETHASDTTLDDLLVSRPGGIVRTRMPGGVIWQQVPSIGTHVFPLLEYQDAAREWRTGVTRQAQGIDADALQNQSATAVNQLYSAAQTRLKLIARIFAETGIKDLFGLLHATIRKHGRKAETVRLRQKWITVDPRDWKARNDMTINVGLGSGGKSERLGRLIAMINLQKEALAGGLANLVTPQNLYNSARELVKLIDLKTVEPYFNDPSQAPPAQPAPDPKWIELQLHAEIEKLQAQGDIETQGKKVAAEIALAERKFELERELKLLDHRLRTQERQAAQLQSAVAAGGEGEGASALVVELLNELKRSNAPKRIVRDDSGRAIGVEPITPSP